MAQQLRINKGCIEKTLYIKNKIKIRYKKAFRRLIRAECFFNNAFLTMNEYQ